MLTRLKLNLLAPGAVKGPVSKSKMETDGGKPLTLTSDLHRHGTHKHERTHMHLVHTSNIIGKKRREMGEEYTEEPSSFLQVTPRVP